MERPKVFRYAQFDLDTLLALAGTLRGRPCTCDVSQPPMTGSMNWAILVSFDDGIQWIFRSPRSGRDAFLSEKSASRMLASEAATLKYIRAHAGFPVPEVFAYSDSPTNGIGVPYILMSKAYGHPLSEYDWSGQAHQPPTSSLLEPLRHISEEGKENIMSQLGAITFQLSQLRLEKIGSLFQDDGGNYMVGECLSPTLVWQQRDSLESVDRGPFDNGSAYFKSLISAYIAHAEELPLTPHAFFAPIPDVSEYASWASYKAAIRRWNDFVAVGQKIDHSKNRLAYCIVGQLMYDMLPNLFDMASDTTSDMTSDGFPLGHPDLHLGNIFVDENLNITCIIDWGSASSVPLAELLKTPAVRNSAFLPEASLIAAFRGGVERASSAEQLRHGIWGNANKLWHFQRLVRMPSIRDYYHFEALCALVYEPERGVEGSVDIPGLFDERRRRSENRQLLDELREGDWSSDHVKEQERAAFGSCQAAITDRFAVARKLTIMSEMNSGFMADWRLWQWVESALEDIDCV